MRPFEAALKGAREIGFTIISITFSLIAVFIPVLLMGGMVGRVFREFAVTIAVAIIVSGFVSLTLTPMLCARVLRAPSRGREAERRAARVRGDVQGVASRLRMVARQGARNTSPSCCWSRSPRSPARSGSTSSSRRASSRVEDTGFISVTIEGPADISFRAMVERQNADRRDHPAGPGGGLCQFDGRRRRPERHQQYRPHVRRPEAEGGARALRPGASAAAPDDQQRHRHAGLFPRDPEHQSRRPHRQERIPVHAAVERDRDALSRLATRCASKIKTIEGLRDVNTDLYIKNPRDRRSRSTARRPRSTASPSIRSARSSTTRSASARSPRSTRRSTTIRSSWRRRPEFQADPSGAVEDLPQDQPRQHGNAARPPAAASWAPARRPACRSRSAPSPS